MDEIDPLSVLALRHEMDLDSENNPLVPHVDETPSRLGAPAGSKRKECSKEQWEELKELIRRLYLDENMTREAVTKCIVEEYGFEPTKRQFNRKISKWGFEKNTKKAERLSVLESAKKQNAFEATTIRGRKLDKTKLERWSKLDGIPLQSEEMNRDAMGESSAFTAQTADEIGTNKFVNANLGFEEDWQTSEVPNAERMDIDSQDGHVTTDDYGCPFNIWETVDIIGSPRLTGLFGALTLYECGSFSLDCSTKVLELEDALEEIERISESNAQDEDDDANTSTAIVTSSFSNRKQTPLIIPKWATQNGPSLGLSPFPTQAANANTKPNHGSSLPPRSPRLSESECKANMRRLSKMIPCDILDLVDSMWSIADRYWNLRDYHSAEAWYRRIVRVKRHVRVRHLEPGETIMACLDVVSCIHHQGRYAEARDIHQDLHKEILHRFPGHELAIESQRILAGLFGSFGEGQQEEAILRELLQKHLNQFGVASREGINAMDNLADCLSRRKLFSQSEQLIRTILQLGTQIPEYLSGGPGRLDAFQTQMDLVRVLNRTDRYLEAEKLLRYLSKTFPDLTAIDNKHSFRYKSYLAETLILQGRLSESEKILLDILHHQDHFLTPKKRANVMLNLARISKQTGRGVEAATWHEKRYILNVETYGLQYGYSMRSCRSIGYCYADGGLFDKAISHFERTISKIELLHKEGGDLTQENGTHDPKECVELLQDWIQEVEQQKAESLEEIASDETSEDSGDDVEMDEELVV